MPNVIVSAKPGKRVSRRQESAPTWFVIIVQCVLISISSFMFYNMGKSIYTANENLKVLEQAEKEVEQLRLENIRLVMLRDTVNEDAYVEKQARDRYNFGRPDEIQYVIPDSVLDRYIENLAQESDVSLEVAELSVVQRWVEFFLKGI